MQPGLCGKVLACLLPRRDGDHEGKKVPQHGRLRVGSIGSVGTAKPVATQEGRLPLRILRMMVRRVGDRPELETLTLHRGALTWSCHFLLSTLLFHLKK